jgi:hypothetical protein
VVFSAAESVAAPAALVFWAVEEQPATTNIKAKDRARPIIFFKAFLHVSVESGNPADCFTVGGARPLFSQRFIGRPDALSYEIS